MRHRGPDNSIVRSLTDDRGALGANEINLSPERTYCTSLEETPFILFDGRLFNERTEGQTDLDLFREYYEKYEKDCFKYLDGSFSCAIVEKNDEVILARDPVGARPLFFGSDNNVFLFQLGDERVKGLCSIRHPGASSRKSLQHKDRDKGFDPFVPDVPEPRDLKDAAAILRELLIEAVKKRMDDVNAISLSGGLDSSIIAVIAKEFNPDLHLFTGSIERFPGPDLENAIFNGRILRHGTSCLSHYRSRYCRLYSGGGLVPGKL